MKLDFYHSLYDVFNRYFSYIDKGRPQRGDKPSIFAFNGGLFAPDDLLDNLTISDDILLKHTVVLSTYDFASEVDVNILGHIFEHSLNEIDEMTAEIEGQAIDKSKTKRKKDGVFYTPKYITKYIVENTVGKLCEEKKTELNILEEDYAKDRKGRKKATLKKLNTQLEQYRQWLLDLTICDPACGSGAFLNQALDFLIAEHRYIDELQTKLLGGGFVFPNVENSILENNLYGVDINEESVEIAKLSLWLRTVKKGRQLTSLNNNIKCGNSLIDDVEVAGDKAFSWEQEFPKVFIPKDKQAFHVVLTTHNSRTSQRMMKLGIKKGEPVELTLKEELELTKIIRDVMVEKNYKCLSYNICKDHVHLILVCEIFELPKIVRTIKSISSRAFNTWKGITTVLDDNSGTRGQAPLERKPDLGNSSSGKPPRVLAPLSSSRGETQNHLWSQKFFRADLDVWKWGTVSTRPGYVYQSTHLGNALSYINSNRQKHELPDIPELQAIIDEMTCSQEEAFVLEYTGGFDVVVGNPPYGAELDQKEWLKIKYKKTSFGNIDSYKYFVQLGSQLVKNKGTLGYIMPDSYLEKEYFKDLRVFISNNFSHIINIKLGDDVFDDVNLPTSIILLNGKGNKSVNFKYLDISNVDKLHKSTSIINNTKFISANPEVAKTLVVIESIIKCSNTKPLIDIYDQVMGVKVYQKGKGKPKQTIYEKENDVFISTVLDETFNYPFISQGINRYFYHSKDEYISYGKWLAEPRKSEYFDNPKVIIREIINPRIFAIYIEKPAVVKNIAAVIIEKDNEYPIKFLLGLINSKLFTYYVNEQSPKSSNKSYPSFNSRLLKELPIIQCSKKDKEEIIKNTNTLLQLNEELQNKSNRFLRRLQTGLNLEKTSKKIESFYDHDFKTLVSELKKKKIKLSLVQQDEWEEYFDAYKAEINQLQGEIAKTDKEIDKMVYELYDLTEEEIEIVENS